MSLVDFIFFDNQLIFFSENFILKQSYINVKNYDFFLQFFTLSDYNFLSVISEPNLHSKSILTFINQTEDLTLFSNLENTVTVYHYSIPNTKLFYPEPFIAAPSFMHSDLWFVHILVYQYWLWFVFIFLIVFFFITFICTVRWCNMRVRPRRETRGVSRSKCGDLVTAIVPVSWAASIIINESTDAIDYYDGFGTTEMVVGIRAYQWGWEYYYPKDLDLNYNLKHNYSAFVGNSLKYNTISEVNVTTSNLWRFYQNKSFDSVVTPAHLLLLPLDNHKMLNFLNFNDIGANNLNESSAFKKIKMFSKTYVSNLSYLPSSFNDRYKNLTSLYISDSEFLDSYLYGSKRQHNFLSSSSLFNNFSTFFSLSSVDCFLRFNWGTSSDLFTTFTGNNLLNFFLKTKHNELMFDTFRLNNFFFNLFPGTFSLAASKFYLYPSLTEVLNNNTDKKKVHYLFFKFFQLPLKKHHLTDRLSLFKINFNNEFSVFNVTPANIFTNKQLINKTCTLFSANQSVNVAEKSLRKFANIYPNTANYNFSADLNPLSTYINRLSLNLNASPALFTNLSNTHWLDLNTFNKLAISRVHVDSPYSPIISNNPRIFLLNYDSCQNTFVEDLPVTLENKEETLPNFLPLIYWNFYWSNTDVNWRIRNVLGYNTFQNAFYLPLFSFYYDYDFRNWQSLELLEDSLWDSASSAYLFDEYCSLSKDFNSFEYFNRFEKFYNVIHKKIAVVDHILSKPYCTDEDSTGNFYSNAISLEDVNSAVNLLVTSKFFSFPLISALSNMEDSYDALKNLSYFFAHNNKLVLNTSLNYFAQISYSLVFDSFRADFEDFTWFLDETFLLNLTPSQYLNNLPQLNFELFLWNFTPFNSSVISLNFNNLPLSFLNFCALFKHLPFVTDNLNNFNVKEFLNLEFLFLVSRFTNFINLRSPVRNSIVTYNAIQKVFRARFDEGRSNVKLFDFANFYNKQPYLSASRVPYETLLGKNKESFFNVNFYKNSFQPIFNTFYSLQTSLNFYFYDFPFLLALKSDASRYLWFDWYAKWGFYEVQPSSTSRYAIYGMPYFSKIFDFNLQSNETINETENYFLRLSRSRRSYLPNWVHTPYFYAKSSLWCKNNLIFDFFTYFDDALISSYNMLIVADWYWKSVYFSNTQNFVFTPSHSNLITYNKNFWKFSSTSIHSYYYKVSNLIDILTKREYLYRELFISNNKLLNLPMHLTNNPNNPLIAEIKSSFLFVDPIAHNNEYSRDIYYSSLSFFNFQLLKALFKDSKVGFNLNFFSDYLYFLFFNESTTNKLGSNSDLFKSQYRPMKKGISNMVRLHATGAMAMPIEIRLQVLASSKDVIHSWSIPSAGIKIDCVPGYSSHRVMIFLVSGIFWGQCMEICGRYHHWMPIIVYFMKRDLFFLWCTHFVFLSGSNNMWTINDRQYTDYVRVATYDKASWVSEFKN